MEVADIVQVTPFEGARERRLYVYLKVRSTRRNIRVEQEWPANDHSEP